MPKVVAVVITYNPKADDFLSLIERLLNQVDSIVVVDNTHRCDDRVFRALQSFDLSTNDFYIIRLGDNYGIAAALNIGWQEAVRIGAEFVVLSDQDSLPATDMVEKLLEAYLCVSSGGNKVAAIGPTFTDLHTKVTYPFQVILPGRFFYAHKAPSDIFPHVEAITLITSGVLIPLAVLEDVGGMREDFFIDHVDIEWCHRARWSGYRLYGTGWASMHQRMGEASLRVWYFRWRNESSYSPLRIYYRLRNFVALWKLGYVDWRWKIRSTWYWLGIVYAHTFFSKGNHGRYIYFALKGIWHGLINRTGVYK